jgi:two-component system, OmpR family, response regulator
MNNESVNPLNPKKRLIVVEDDLDLREDLVEYLSRHGYEVTGVGTASEFYLKLVEANYDLAILDIGLPDQSGLVLAEYVRKNTAMKIVILSARVNIEDRIAGYEAGADVYMIKPFDSRELLLFIANIINRPGSDPSLAKDAASNTVNAKQHDAEAWALIRKDWLLQSPKRDGVQLTSTEFEFILIMTKEPFGAVVNRKDILEKLDYQHNEYGSRAFESMAYRLRKKIETMGELMPIKTYRGIGYSLSLPIICI